MENPIPSYLRFTPGKALPHWYRFIARALTGFYYSSIGFVDERGQRVCTPDDGIPTLFLTSHRNGATDGWMFSRVSPRAQFLAAVQLLRSRFLRLLFTGIPVVRDKDRQRYGFSWAQAGNPALHGIAHLKQGGDLIIFPEGTSEWGPAPQPYQPGAVKIIRRLLQEGYALRVIPVGSFYQAPDVFGSRVELMIGAPLALPDRAEKTQDAWEAEITECVREALDRVSVNCADEETLTNVQRYARQCRRRGESYAAAFKRVERSAVPVTDVPETTGTIKKAWAWAWQLPFVSTLFPVLLCAWLAGRRADGRNTVTFFRLAGGFAAAMLWLPCLAVAGVIYPWLWLWYCAAYLGWRQRAVWGEGGV